MAKITTPQTQSAWERITIRNRYMFALVMMNPGICTEFLEKMLEIKIERIEYVDAEKTFSVDPDTKGIRLDVYVKDKERAFDIELQCVDTYELPLRSRFYQSLLDTDFLDKGESYKMLPESFVIFVCTFDLFEAGLPIYTFKNVCLENNSVILNDKTWKVFYNVDAFKKELDPEKRAILEYFSNGEAKSDFTDKVDKEVVRNRGRREYRRQFMTWEQEIKIYGEKVAIDVRNEMQPIIDQLSSQNDQQAARIAELEAQLAELQKSAR